MSAYNHNSYNRNNYSRSRNTYTYSRSRVMADEDAGRTDAVDLLFEVNDVADLLAEITGEDVDVSVDDDTVTFGIGEDEYTITAGPDTEILESSHRRLDGRRTVSASRDAYQRRSPSRTSNRSRR